MKGNIVFVQTWRSNLAVESVEIVAYFVLEDVRVGVCVGSWTEEKNNGYRVPPAVTNLPDYLNGPWRIYTRRRMARERRRACYFVVSSIKDIVSWSFIEYDADDQQKGDRNAMSDFKQE